MKRIGLRKHTQQQRWITSDDDDDDDENELMKTGIHRLWLSMFNDCLMATVQKLFFFLDNFKHRNVLSYPLDRPENSMDVAMVITINIIIFNFFLIDWMKVSGNI